MIAAPNNRRWSFFFRFQEAERPTGGHPKITLDPICLKDATPCLSSHLNLVLSRFAPHKSDLGWSTFGGVHWSIVGKVAPQYLWDQAERRKARPWSSEKLLAWREMPVILRQISLRHDRMSFDKKIQKNKWRRPTHGFLHLNLKSLVRQAHERSCKLMSFRLGFFWGDQSGPLHGEKLPNSYSSPVAFPSVLKHLSSDTVKGCSSSSWVAAYLGSTTSLSPSERK